MFYRLIVEEGLEYTPTCYNYSVWCEGLTLCYDLCVRDDQRSVASHNLLS